MKLISGRAYFALFSLPAFFISTYVHASVITYTQVQSDEIAGHATRAVRLAECVALGAQAKVDGKKLQVLAKNFSKESDEFLAGIDAGNISKEAAGKIPMIWSALLNDYHTSYEFVKGALWNAEQEQARKAFSEGIDSNQTWSKYSSALTNSAALLYNDKNCELL
ncbi:hypothetical protein [Pantoea phytobeneficialis]|uniref:Uncharacterized protein n=1 Tax=Pantoea phytobeneficialis TaxID=2052056 RepID=A0AAP9KSF1_9GAMM|nr:hypothetical protein [Pantoea phytobeneficialis]MDO6409890.1 hypothetical protein [Pantoea phytobeneficialis]QGR09762.1 hypothetical protein CTZ24_25225 [Pantoea phytobeneficialis]